MSKKLKDKIYTSSQDEIEKENTWIGSQINKIGENTLNKLAREAAKVRLNAYGQYSGYLVGASLLTVDGKIYSSCNAEVVSFTETDHAERSVITKAISEGAFEKNGRKFIKAVAVSHPENSGPCGGCRQKIAEHANNCLVLDVDQKGEIVAISSLKILFPYAFTPANLKVK